MAKAAARVAKAPARRPWSKDDIRLLKSAARKEPVAKIAKALKRTEGATRQKAQSEGISLSTTSQEANTRKEALRRRANSNPVSARSVPNVRVTPAPRC